MGCAPSQQSYHSTVEAPNPTNDFGKSKFFFFVCFFSVLCILK